MKFTEEHEIRANVATNQIAIDFHRNRGTLDALIAKWEFWVDNPDFIPLQFVTPRNKYCKIESWRISLQQLAQE